MDADTIVEIHAWIIIEEDESEGLISADLPYQYPDGKIGSRHMPLLNTDREKAVALGPMARVMQRVGFEASGRPTRIALRTFRAVQS